MPFFIAKALDKTLCRLLRFSAAQYVNAFEQVHRLIDLVVLILQAWLFIFVGVAAFVRAAVTIAQVSNQVRFFNTHCAVFLAEFGTLNEDVRNNALGLDGAAFRRVLQGCSEL